MDRRSFVTSMLTLVGILAVTVGAANALSAVAPRDHLVSADDDGIENVWWRRRYWRRGIGAPVLAALVSEDGSKGADH